MMPTRCLSRRSFVRRTSVAAASGVLLASGCAPKPTAAPPPTAALAAQQPTTAPTTRPEPTSAPPPAAEVVTITVFVGFGTGSDPAQIKADEQFVREFTAEHRNTRIEYIRVPFEERGSKFTTMLAGGLAPELCMPIGIDGVALFFDEWADIGPYIDRDSYDLSGFVGPTVSLHTYGEKVVGLPLGVYPEVVYYNEDLFDDADAEYPPHEFGDPDWTFDKLLQLCKVLSLDSRGSDSTSPSFDWRDEVQWGWDGGSWQFIRDYAPKFGGNPLAMTDDYKTALVNSPPWVTAVQFLADTIWKWHVRATGEQSSSFYDVAGDPFGTGKVAMWNCLSWMSPAYQGWADAFNWDMAAIPAGPGGQVVSDASADTFVMPSHSRHPDQAWEYGKWMASPEVLARLAASWGCIPARAALSASWKAEMDRAWPTKDWQVMLDSIEYIGVPSPESWTPEPQKVNDIINKAWDLIASGENQDAQEVLDKANAEVQAVLDEYWQTR